MLITLDYTHPCPWCGSPWKVRFELAVPSGSDDKPYRVPEDSGTCLDRRCSISPGEVAAFRDKRRQRGWDPTLTAAA